ncbi:MAG: HPP family protein [Candidatus Pristimantibacillus sp.]
MFGKITWIHITAALGGALTIALLLLIGDTLSMTMLMPSFGASCMIAFTMPNGPFSKSRSIIGGHVISTTIGLIIHSTLGSSIWAIALSIGLSIIIMQLTHTTHPPACGDPLVVALSNVSWSFLLSPVLAGAVLIAIFSYFYRRIHNAAVVSTVNKISSESRNNDSIQQEQAS